MIGLNNMRKLLSLVCFLLVFSMLLCVLPASANEEMADEEKAPETVQIVRFTKNLPRGTRVLESHLETDTVKNVNVPKNIISDPKDAIGKYLKNDCYATEYLYKEQLSGEAIPKVNWDLLIKPINNCIEDYVIVTDYVVPNTGEDLSYFLQEIIDKNPKRTIYFPDGEYVIATSLFTSAGGGTSVDIQLSDGAVIKAANNFAGKDEKEAMICLGAAKDVNDISSIGSYYSLKGGMLDGNNRANGISIDSGRESVIRNICIKNAIKGIVVEDGTNNVSSDCDFEDITIISNPKDSRTVGMELIGFDNSFTNIRIYDAHIGILDTVGAGNLMKSIYVIKTEAGKYYNNSVGILGTVDNWYSQCYIENYETAYELNAASKIWDCTAAWTDEECKKQIAIKTPSINLALSGIKVFFLDNGGETAFLTGPQAAGANAPKTIEAPIFNTALCKGDRHLGYMTSGGVIPLP